MEYLEVTQAIGNGLLLVRAVDEGRLKRHLDQDIDDLEEPLREVFKDVLSENKDVFVSAEQWERVCGSGSQTGEARIDFLSMYNHEPFVGATLLGANIEHSLLYKHLTAWGAVFKPHQEVVDRLRYREYPTAMRDRVVIEYVLPDVNFSKTLEKKPYGTTTYGATLDEQIELALHDERFLLVANKDYSGRLKTLPGCTVLPTISHGLNSYTDYNVIVFRAALNRTPGHIGMLKAIGVKPEDIRIGTAYEVMHQCVMRTSLRDPSATGDVRIIVPDRRHADFLVHTFGETRVKQIGDFEYTKKRPLSQVDRNRRSQYKKEMQLLFQKQNQDSLRNSFTYKEKRNDSCPAEPTSPTPARNPTFIVTLQNSFYAKHQKEFHVWELDWKEFKKNLRDCSKVVLASKENNILFNLTEFDPTIDSDGFRRKANIIGIYGMILDFDGGDVSPDDFIEIFWNKPVAAKKIAFMITNSFSRSEQEPNRFRVIIPYKRPVRSVEEHEAVFDAFEAIFEAAGYNRDGSGLDRSSRSGIQSFYLPCTNRNSPELAFFEVYGMDRQRDFDRYAVDPRIYGATGHVETRPNLKCGSVAAATDQVLDRDRNARVIQEVYDEYGHMTTGRHTAVLSAANKLVTAVSDEIELEQSLVDVFGNEPHMLKKIGDVVKKLEEEGRN